MSVHDPRATLRQIQDAARCRTMCLRSSSRSRIEIGPAPLEENVGGHSDLGVAQMKSVVVEAVPKKLLGDFHSPSREKTNAKGDEAMKRIEIFKPLGLSARISVGLLLLRLVSGLAFMFHGYGKIQNPFGWMGPDAGVPGIFQMLAAVSEFGGGLAWILGLLTPLASFGLACTMTVAVYTHAFVLHDPFVAKGPGKGSFELASAYFCVAVLLLFAGPGRFAVDRIIFGEKPSHAPMPEAK